MGDGVKLVELYGGLVVDVDVMGDVEVGVLVGFGGEVWVVMCVCKEDMEENGVVFVVEGLLCFVVIGGYVMC